MPVLKRMLSPGGDTLRNAITTAENMFQRIDPTTPDLYRQKTQALSLMIAAGNVYLYALRMQIVLDAVISADYVKNGNTAMAEEIESTWRGHHVVFTEELMGSNGLCSRVKACMDDPVLRQKRIDFIQLEQYPAEGHYEPHCVKTPRGKVCIPNHILDHDSGWCYFDHITNATQRARPQSMDPDAKTCDRPNEHKDEAERLRASYVKAVIANEFEKPEKLIGSWIDAGNSWDRHQAPEAPITKLKVCDDWSARTPQGANWKKGHSVEYAAKFFSASGPSPMGPITTCEIEDGAFPLLTEIPFDTTDTSIQTLICRRFKLDELTFTSWRQIAQVKSTCRDFRDTLL